MRSSKRSIALSFRLRAISSDVAHELRTPLNRIAAVADLAAAESDTDALAALDTIQTTIRELTRMVDALLLMSELDSGGAKLDFECVDIGARISDATKLFAPAFEDSGRMLHVDVEEVFAEIVPELFDRVIFNLLENELSHTPEGSHVDVVCRVCEGGYQVVVQDDGAGFVQDDLESVFDRFTRRPHSGESGHGLGLAIARTIAELHGGTIRAEAAETGGARLVWDMPTAWAPEELR